MGVLTRATRNISRRKARALLVIIALAFSITIMISIPAGVIANQRATENLTTDLTSTITKTEASINQTQKQLDCRLDPTLAGYGATGTTYVGATMYNPYLMLGLDPPEEEDVADLAFQELFGSGGNVLMKQTLYSDIASIEGVAAVVPILRKNMGYNITREYLNRYFNAFVINYKIESVPLTSDIVDNYPVLPTNITAGRTLQAGDSGGVLLSNRITGFFGTKVPRYGFYLRAEVGDTISILGRTFTVIGIFEPAGADDMVSLFMDLSEAQSLTGNIGDITEIRVFTESSDVVTQVANAIKSEHEELIAVTGETRLEQLAALKTQYTAALEDAENALVETESVATQEIFVVVAATSSIVLFVMLYTVRERTKEIGTLKAMGFSKWTVMRQFMLEGILLSLIAGIVGVGIGTFAAPTLSSFLLPGAGSSAGSAATVTIGPELMLLAFGAAILLGTLGSLYPAWRAAKIRPAEAMRYE
ncbi:MAG: FtsX-like permease family protein [Candidatus Bathyarchaeota archaeon]|nr:FtsX-like permease family protein [Candidatus Bathyarchaeota archaeon]MCW4001815.1 FtsX-like permease family protein [Candidatus Bathyarchaeota archaeon]MCZ2807734.1 FtsX-like permease family protein [Candidatus Bathyarchaeota archaeon]